MVIIDALIEKGQINKIPDLEIERYLNFFESSYKDNFEHSNKNSVNFPRWSIISGYYAMHDITKLFLAKKFNIKVDSKVHKTVIKIMEQLAEDDAVLELLKTGYEEFTKMAADLFEAREERQKVQYYTGTKFMDEEYRKKSKDFQNNVVLPYLDKIKEMLE